MWKLFTFALVAAICDCLLVLPAFAKPDPICEGFGPQAPRDIDHFKGNNKRIFNIAPPANKLNLCNIDQAVP